MGRLWIHRGAPAALVQLGLASVAVMRVDEAQRHIGVVHHDDAGELRMLHLAWHHDLREDVPVPPSVIVDPGLPRARARSVAAMCRLVWRRHQAGGLPYGLRYRAG